VRVQERRLIRREFLRTLLRTLNPAREEKKRSRAMANLPISTSSNEAKDPDNLLTNIARSLT